MFNVVSYIEINAVSFTILFLLYASIHGKRVNSLLGQKLFVLLLCSNALMLVLDALQWVLDGVPGAAAREAYLIITVIYFIFNPLPCLLWSLYVNYMVYKSRDSVRRLIIPLSIPLIINTILSIISGFNGCMFYFDSNNRYHRGYLFFVLAVICYSYLLYSLIFIIRKQKQIEEKFLMPILAYIFPPVIGGILQALFYGLSLVWVCTTISILILYLNIQNNQLYIDHLTGLYNRRHLDYFLQERIKSCKDNKLLAAIMIDVNSFKNINDIWGHSAGDEALIETGKILKTSLGRNDLVCRYGGDEFVVILEIKEESEITSMVNVIKDTVRQFNEENQVPYEISLSMGYDTYDHNIKMTLQEFLNHIDLLMYQDKKLMKQIEY